MEFIDKKTIRMDKEINELDKLSFKFIDILKKYANYVIVSGYVAILFGRSRGTEDVDIILEKIEKERFYNFYGELINNDFWCLNTDDIEEIYSLLEDRNSVRFALKDTFQPNFELKFISNSLHEETIKNKIMIIINKEEIFTSPIEMQIAYKEVALKSEKDKEDAVHLREVLRGKIDEKLIENYKKLIIKSL